MLTCDYFRTIAKRHFIRIVCLTNVEKIDAFASYLTQLVESGEYGNSVLPTQHLAVTGMYRSHHRRFRRRRSDAEPNAKRVVSFIITTAAPSLLTLAIYGIDADHRLVFPSEGLGIESFCVTCVPNETKFPKLRDLIALNQRVLHLVLQDDSRKPDKRACQLRYPNIRRLYIPSCDGSSLVSTLPDLHDLRLDTLENGSLAPPPPPREELDHVCSLIFDFPRYISWIGEWDQPYIQPREEYDSKIGEYRTLIEEVGISERNGIVVPGEGFTGCTTQSRVLSGWADAVVGGGGCWTTAWTPTNPRTHIFKGWAE